MSLIGSPYSEDISRKVVSYDVDPDDPFIQLSEYMYKLYQEDFQKFHNYYQAFNLLHQNTIQYFHDCTEQIDLELYEMLKPIQDKFVGDIGMFFNTIWNDLAIFLYTSYSQNHFNKRIKDPVMEHLMELSQKRIFDPEPWRLRLNKISELYNIVKNNYIRSITPKQVTWNNTFSGFIQDVYHSVIGEDDETHRTNSNRVQPTRRIENTIDVEQAALVRKQNYHKQKYSNPGIWKTVKNALKSNKSKTKTNQTEPVTGDQYFTDVFTTQPGTIMTF